MPVLIANGMIATASWIFISALDAAPLYQTGGAIQQRPQAHVQGRACRYQGGDEAGGGGRQEAVEQAGRREDVGGAQERERRHEGTRDRAASRCNICGYEWTTIFHSGGPEGHPLPPIERSTLNRVAS